MSTLTNSELMYENAILYIINKLSNVDTKLLNFTFYVFNKLEFDNFSINHGIDGGLQLIPELAVILNKLINENKIIVTGSGDKETSYSNYTYGVVEVPTNTNDHQNAYVNNEVMEIIKYIHIHRKDYVEMHGSYHILSADHYKTILTGVSKYKFGVKALRYRR